MEVTDDEIQSDSDVFEFEDEDDGSMALVNSRAELLALQQAQEKFMRNLNANAQKADRAARIAARAQKH